MGVGKMGLISPLQQPFKGQTDCGELSRSQHRYLFIASYAS